MKMKWVLLAVAVSVLASTSYSNPPTELDYQGKVLVSDVPFTGNGYFKFAVGNVGGTTNYWSNDGTTVGQPTGCITNSVFNGVFSTVLGATPMSAINPDIFSNGNDLYLRVWFGTTNSTFNEMLPAQKIESSAYAINADQVDGMDANEIVAAATNGVSLSGDITGSPASGTTVNSLQGDALNLGAATAGQILTWNGSAWTNASGGMTGASASNSFVIKTGDTMTGILGINVGPFGALVITNTGGDVQVGGYGNARNNGTTVGAFARGTNFGAAVGYQANGDNSGVAVGGSANGERSGAAVGTSALAGTNGAAVGVSADGRYYGAAVGFAADGQNAGMAAGYNARGSTYGAAVGQNARGEDYGAALGSSAQGQTNGAAVGSGAVGDQYGSAVGASANGNSYGVAVGYGALGRNSGVAVGRQSTGYNDGVGVGRTANGADSGVAVGYSSMGTNYGTAVGWDSTGDDGGVAVGVQSIGSGYGVAVGEQAIGVAAGAAVGSRANGSISGSALGNRANGSAHGAAVGNFANAHSYGVAIGDQAAGTNSGVAVGRDANGHNEGVAVGRFAQGVNGAVAVGYAANGQNNGAAVGQQANADAAGASVGAFSDANTDGAAVGYNAKAYTQGAAVGRDANGADRGASMGYQSSGPYEGVALGYTTYGEFRGIGIGYAADGANTNIAIGAGANSRNGNNSIAIGQGVQNIIAESARIRGTLYMDGGTAVVASATFGSGNWRTLVPLPPLNNVVWVGTNGTPAGPGTVDRPFDAPQTAYNFAATTYTDAPAAVVIAAGRYPGLIMTAGNIHILGESRPQLSSLLVNSASAFIKGKQRVENIVVEGVAAVTADLGSDVKFHNCRFDAGLVIHGSRVEVQDCYASGKDGTAVTVGNSASMISEIAIYNSSMFNKDGARAVLLVNPLVRYFEVIGCEIVNYPPIMGGIPWAAIADLESQDLTPPQVPHLYSHNVIHGAEHGTWMGVGRPAVWDPNVTNGPTITFVQNAVWGDVGMNSNRQFFANNTVYGDINNRGGLMFWGWSQLGVGSGLDPAGNIEHQVSYPGAGGGRGFPGAWQD